MMLDFPIITLSPSEELLENQYVDTYPKKNIIFNLHHLMTSAFKVTALLCTEYKTKLKSSINGN